MTKSIRTVSEFVLIALIAGLLIGYLTKSPEPITTIETVVDTVFVETIDTVTVTSPAIIDTVYIETENGHFSEIRAYTQETISGNNYSIKFTVEYWFERNIFDIETEVRVTERVVFVTNNITKYATQRKTLLRPFVGFGISKHAETHFAQFSAGVSLMERIDLYVSADTSERIGFGVNYRF